MPALVEDQALMPQGLQTVPEHPKVRGVMDEERRDVCMVERIRLPDAWATIEYLRELLKYW